MISAIVLVLLIVLVMAIDTVSTGWRVTTTEKTINVWSNCKTADKTGGGLDVFAPTKTAAEWTAFIAGKPASVTLAACIFTTWSNPGTFLGYCCEPDPGCDTGFPLSGSCSPGGSTRDYESGYDMNNCAGEQRMRMYRQVCS